MKASNVNTLIGRYKGLQILRWIGVNRAIIVPWHKEATVDSDESAKQHAHRSRCSGSRGYLSEGKGPIGVQKTSSAKLTKVSVDTMMSNNTVVVMGDELQLRRRDVIRIGCEVVMMQRG